MKTLYRKKAWFCLVVFISFLFGSSPNFATETQYFNCATDTGSMGSEDPTAKREGLAVYACKASPPAGTTALPNWWNAIWSTGGRPSVYMYYKDVSRGRYEISAEPYGADDAYCFTSGYDPGTAGSPNTSFINDILSKLDERVSLSAYDKDFDDTVDAVFFFVCRDTNTVPDGVYKKNWGVLYRSPTDKGLDNQSMIIGGSRVVWIRAQTGDWATAIAAHEWGHRLGLPDLYDYRETFRGLGGFSLMGLGYPQGRAVPLDPWSMQKLGWDSTVEVTGPIYGKSIPDYATTGVIYKLPKDSMEYFLLTNYYGREWSDYPATYWEGNFKGFGPMIWHVDNTASGDVLVQSHKFVDAELAHGLYTSDHCNFTTTPNPASGFDSLDVFADCGLPDTSLQSGSCFWNAITQKTTFDGLSNPNSAGYVDSVSNGMRVQIAPTHIAVRNIQTANDPGYDATADLLVNNWYGHITATTTWGPNKGYAITGDIIVDSGYTLTIDSGTTVYLQNGEDNQRAGVDTTKIEIRVAKGGSLIVNGKPGFPVKFLSSRPESQAGTDDWQGIIVKPGAVFACSNAVIRHAYIGIEDSSKYLHTIQNVKIGRCTFGIFASKTDSLTIRGCRIDSVYDAVAGGTGIQVSTSSTNTVGARLVKDTVRACYYGIYILYSTTPVESCLVVGDSTGSFVSSIGIKNYGQGYHTPATNLSVTNTSVVGYFSGQHFLNMGSGRASISTCDFIANQTSPHSPMGIRNASGDYLKVRGSNIWYWGLYGVKSDDTTSGLDLGVYPSDNGYNALYTSVSGSSWKFVYDAGCGGCSTPQIKAEKNQLYTIPSSSRFSSNVDFTPYLPVESPPKVVAQQEQEKEILPRRTELYQNYPNPFNPTTLIQFHLQQAEKVNLEIFNILGQKVRTILSGEEFAAGPYRFLWDGKDNRGSPLSSGMYFYRLSTSTYLETKKMMLVK